MPSGHTQKGTGFLEAKNLEERKVLVISWFFVLSVFVVVGGRRQLPICMTLLWEVQTAKNQIKKEKKQESNCVKIGRNMQASIATLILLKQAQLDCNLLNLSRQREKSYPEDNTYQHFFKLCKQGKYWYIAGFPSLAISHSKPLNHSFDC